MQPRKKRLHVVNAEETPSLNLIEKPVLRRPEPAPPQPEAPKIDPTKRDGARPTQREGLGEGMLPPQNLRHGTPYNDWLLGART